MKRSLIKLVSLATVVLIAVSCKDKKDGLDYTLLDPWKGTYTVTAHSFYGASQVPPTTNDDMTWTVVVAQVDTSETMLSFTGILGADAHTIYATLDPVALTISFKPGENIGNLFSIGDILLYYASSDIYAHVNSDIEQTYIDAVATTNITGTIQTNGAIAIDKMAMIVQGPLVWDVFNTTWVKQ
jgi:hypothetical protein